MVEKLDETVAKTEEFHENDINNNKNVIVTYPVSAAIWTAYFKCV
jgi:hypothetical protein